MPHKRCRTDQSVTFIWVQMEFFFPSLNGCCESLPLSGIVWPVRQQDEGERAGREESVRQGFDQLAPPSKSFFLSSPIVRPQYLQLVLELSFSSRQLSFLFFPIFYFHLIFFFYFSFCLSQCDTAPLCARNVIRQYSILLLSHCHLTISIKKLVDGLSNFEKLLSLPSCSFYFFPLCLSVSLANFFSTYFPTSCLHRGENRCVGSAMLFIDCRQVTRRLLAAAVIFVTPHLRRQVQLIVHLSSILLSIQRKVAEQGDPTVRYSRVKTIRALNSLTSYIKIITKRLFTFHFIYTSQSRIEISHGIRKFLNEVKLSQLSIERYVIEKRATGH